MRGLTQVEARNRLSQYGPNSLPEPKSPTVVARLVRQFASPIIYLLLFALAFDLGIWLYEGAIGFPLESAAIGVILTLNATLGAYQEFRADTAIAKLREMAAPLVWAFRDGRVVHIPARDLVPGDHVRLEAGDRIAADGLLVESSNAMADESILTGESVPIEKQAGDKVSSGTRVVRGQATFEVTDTGSRSSLGKLASTLETIRVDKTPLERKLDGFGGLIARWVLALAVAIFLVGVTFEGVAAASRVLLFAVALAVAAVPEGMPAVLTLTLTRGIERMAARKAIVRRSSAVEALGSITVIATDKTGTLTENRMFVRELKTADHSEALFAMVLSNDADPEGGAGDPLELALFAYAKEHGIDPGDLREAHKRLDSLSFDSSRKYMSVTVERGGDAIRYLKGAPETVLQMCGTDDADERRWQAIIEDAARTGHRLLGFAAGHGGPEHPLTFLGVALLWDQPRPEVPEAIRKAAQSGVRVMMVTGDHPSTSLSLAESVGLQTSGVLVGDEMDSLDAIPPGVNVFARMLPEHKLRLVEMLKSQGEIVAMTGDGVNDAPALKRADVGVAMGQRGSDVAREVSDMVLLDDNFATIVAAMEQGRGIFANIQKFIRFLFSTNLAEIVIVVGGAFGSVLFNLRDSAGGLLLPLTAIHLLYINLVTDGPVALALGMDENPDAMSKPPRDPKTPLLDRDSTRFVIVTGFAKALVGIGLLLALPFLTPSPEAVRTGLFHYMVLAQLAFSYPSRGTESSKPNIALAGAVGFVLVLQLGFASVPAMQAALGLTPLTSPLVLTVAVAALATWIGAEAYTRLRRT